MPLLQKIISSKEIGLVIQLASFVMHMKQSIIYSLVALLPSLSGAQLLLPLNLPRTLGVSPSFFGGFPNLSLLAATLKLLDLQLYAGPFGNLETEPVLRISSLVRLLN
jgi:hypothetical protein